MGSAMPGVADFVVEVFVLAQEFVSFVYPFLCLVGAFLSLISGFLGAIGPLASLFCPPLHFTGAFLSEPSIILIGPLLGQISGFLGQLSPLLRPLGGFFRLFGYLPGLVRCSSQPLDECSRLIGPSPGRRSGARLGLVSGLFRSVSGFFGPVSGLFRPVGALPSLLGSLLHRTGAFLGEPPLALVGQFLGHFSGLLSDLSPLLSSGRGLLSLFG